MRLCLSIVASASLLALVAMADGWVHSPDGRTIDRIAQPLPRLGVNLLTDQGENMRECDAGQNAMCGWFRVVPATQPTGTMLIARGWTITNMTAVEVLTVTNFPPNSFLLSGTNTVRRMRKAVAP